MQKEQVVDVGRVTVCVLFITAFDNKLNFTLVVITPVVFGSTKHDLPDNQFIKFPEKEPALSPAW